MKKQIIFNAIILASLIILSCFTTASAQNKGIAGEWEAEWNAGIGIMTCHYTFKVDGNVITGKVTAEMNGTESESVISDGKIDGDTITFAWTFDNTVKMVYTGKVNGDEIKFSRKPGSYATEEAVATRVK